MRGRWIGVVVVLCAVLALEWIVFRHSPAGPFIIASVALATTTIMTAFLFPAVGRFVVANSRAVRWTGVLVAVLAVAGGALGSTTLTLLHHESDETWIGISVVGACVGLSLFTLGRSDGNLKRAVERLERGEGWAPVKPTSSRISGIAIGASSFASTFRDIGLAFLLALPWIVVICAGPRFLTRWLLAQRGEHIGFLSPIPAKPHAGYAVAEFLLEVLLVYVAIPAFSIAWVKSQRNRKMGRIALPSLASLRLSVRVWFFVLLLGFVGAMVSTLGADIAGWLGIKDVATMTNSFLWIGALLVVGGATPFALGWPAAALGEKLDRMGSMQLAAKAGVGSSLPGTILAILPFVLGFWGAVVLVGRVPGEQFRQMLYGPLFLVFLFLGTASWSTFVGRIYAYAKGEGPDATQLAPSPVSELP